MTVTDEQLDARLRAAGEAWRAGLDTTPTGNDPATPVPVEPAPRAGARSHRRVTLLASAAVVAAALVLLGSLVFRDAGGHSTGGASGAQASLVGTVWRLLDHGEQPPRRNSTATLYIGADGHLVADDSCAAYGAQVVARDGRLVTTHWQTRARGCTDSVGEVSFTGGDARHPSGIETLRRNPAYSLDGATLTIGSMHFAAAPRLPIPSLDIPTFEGATWRLARVVDAHGTTRPGAGTLKLHVSDGKLAVQSGCVTVDARIDWGGDQVALSDVRYTDPIPCPAGLASASVVEDVFAGPRLRMQIRGTTLTLTRSGAGTLTYAWVPDDPTASDPDSVTGTSWRLVSIAGQPASARATLRVASDGSVTGSDGCRNFAGQARLGTGVLTLTGTPSRPPTGCAGADQASTIDSFLTSSPVRWAVRDGQLLIFGGGAQAFSLIYEPASQ